VNQVTEEPKNELIVLEKADKWKTTMLAKRDEKIYPIPQQLRKELDILKSAQIGNLTSQLKFIRSEKYKEFCDANQDKIEQEREKTQKTIALIETGAAKLIADMQAMARKFQATEEKLLEGREEFIKKDKGYHWKEVMENLGVEDENDADDEKLSCTYQFSEEKFKDTALKEEFKRKFGIGFEEAQKAITTLEEKFKEALLFGDIELVKDIYFTMKRADEFLSKVQQMKVK